MNIFAILAAASLGLAGAPEMPSTYTLLCQGEQSIGFNWRGGAWVKSQYEPPRYIVAKIEANKCAIPLNGALQKLSDDMFMKSACINIRRMEDKYSPWLSQKCAENYWYEGSVWTRSFACELAMTSFVGNFEGEYHRTSNHYDTAKVPQNGYKDSLVVEVGACTLIS